MDGRIEAAYPILGAVAFCCTRSKEDFMVILDSYLTPPAASRILSAVQVATAAS